MCFSFALSLVVVVMEPTALMFLVKASPPENYTEEENARIQQEILVSKLSCAYAGKLTSLLMADWVASFSLEVVVVCLFLLVLFF